MRTPAISISAAILLALAEAVPCTATTESYSLGRWGGQPTCADSCVILQLAEQAPIGSLDHRLTRVLASRLDRHRMVIEALQRTQLETQSGLVGMLAELQSRGVVASFRPFWIANLIAVSASPEAIEMLAGHPAVARVHPAPAIRPVRPVRTGPRVGPGALGAGHRGIGIAPGLQAIRAPEVWFNLGVTGHGSLVASIDTGVDGSHPALRDQWRGSNGHSWESSWLDVQGGQTQFPWDPADHGTHVMGTMTGLAAEDTIGVAWGAQWIAANAISDQPYQLAERIIMSFQWLADPDGNPATVDDVPDVIENSWGVCESNGYAPCTDLWDLVIDNCEAAGTVVIFAAGNRGPDPSTMDSPADRAEDALNSFSIGAVDAANYGWPYPVPDFSSRGPSTCGGVPEFQVKPELSAPGVAVYSSIPGDQYLEADGTSMAGPHVAGVVALMRSVNPDLEVGAIKQILLETARDAGAPGEDNDYGWGCLDAYEAVLQSLGGSYGTCLGRVTNQEGEDLPVPFARISILATGDAFAADADGYFRGLLQPGEYVLEASHPSFAAELRPGVVIEADSVTVEDFFLQDIAGPKISEVVQPRWFEHPEDPLRIRATISDYSPLAGVSVVWRVNEGVWSAEALTLFSQDRYEGLVPGQPLSSIVDYYLEAVDSAGNASLDPPGAPHEYRTIEVLETYFADDAETDKGWILFLEEDAENGRWVRCDPYGTQLSGEWVEPPDDHTPDEGVACFLTGEGFEGAQPHQSDVDDGCVNLTSPIIDLQAADSPMLSYWRWFALLGFLLEGSFEAKVSNDQGASWTRLEFLTENANTWSQSVFDLESILPLTDGMCFRFTACDEGMSLVEAAIDDISILAASPTADIGDRAFDPFDRQLTVGRATPNPGSDVIKVDFSVASEARVFATIHDSSGRLIRTLGNYRLEAGSHTLAWNGRDDAEHLVAAGVYHLRVATSAGSRAQKVLIVR